MSLAQAPRDAKRLVLENLLFLILGVLGVTLVATQNPDASSFVGLFGGVFFGAGFTPLVLNGWSLVIGPWPKGKRKQDALRTAISFVWMAIGLTMMAVGSDSGCDDVCKTMKIVLFVHHRRSNSWIVRCACHWRERDRVLRSFHYHKAVFRARFEDYRGGFCF